MENIKKFSEYSEVSESVTPEVKVGDTITLINNTAIEGDSESQAVVQKVYPDGRILTDDRGHGVIAEYGLEGYEAWCVAEDNEEGDVIDGDEPTGSCQNPTCRKYLYGGGSYCDSECEEQADNNPDSWMYGESVKHIKRFHEINESETSLTVNHPNVQKVINMLKEIDVDGETIQHIIEELGMNDQMLRQLVLSNSQSDTKDLLDEHIRLSDQELNRNKSQSVNYDDDLEEDEDWEDEDEDSSHSSGPDYVADLTSRQRHYHSR